MDKFYKRTFTHNWREKNEASGEFVYRSEKVVVDICDVSDVVYRIEHRSRGIYLGYDHSPSTGEWGPRFSNSEKHNRADGKTFYSLKEEIRETPRFKDAYILIMRRKY